MRIMFSVYCKDGTNAMKMYYRLSKIQIKTILLMETVPNETEKHREYEYVINMLTDVKKCDYMQNAITERIKNEKENMLEIYEVIEAI